MWCETQYVAHGEVDKRKDQEVLLLETLII
jgi:hypothetical protein